MGVLYYGPAINKPSHLWMRRMLEGLGQEVALLVDYMDPGSGWRNRFEVLTLGKKTITWPPILRKYQYYQERRIHEKLLLPAMVRSDVDSALIHFLVYAVKYREVWRKISKPVYVHCHGMDVTWDLKPYTKNWQRKKIYSRRYLNLVRNLTDNVSFIANSLITKHRLESIGIDSDRIHVKYLGVPVPDLAPDRRIKKESLLILYLGRLVDFKGPDLVIRAFSKACEQGLNAKLQIAGDGPMLDECRFLARTSLFANCIEFLGAVTADQGEALRNEADIFTAHNQHGPVSGQEEAFGVAFVEAMAAGLPVVTGRNGSIAEIIDDGIEGLLFTPGDIAAHAQALLSLARDHEQRVEMGQRGWARVKKQFSLDQEISNLKRILHR